MHSLLRGTSAALLVLSVSACKQSPKTASDVVALTKASITSAKSYKASIRSEISSRMLGRNTPGAPEKLMTSSTQLQSVLPDKLRLEVSTKSSAPTAPLIKVVVMFDGTTEWIHTEMSMPAGGMAAAPVSRYQKLDQKKLAPKDHPFATGFDIRGAGLLPGKDLLGSIRHFIDAYEYAPEVKPATDLGADCVKVSGRVTPEALVDELFDGPGAQGGKIMVATGSTAAPGPQNAKSFMYDMVAMQLVAVETLEMTLCGPKKLPKQILFGSPDAPLMSLFFDELTLEHPVDPSTFTIAEDKKTEYRDVTEEGLRVQRQSKRAYEDTARRTALRNELLERVKARTASTTAGAAPTPQ